MLPFLSKKVALNNDTSVRALAVALDDDSITDILQSAKIRSILGVEPESDSGYITPLSDNPPPRGGRKSRTRRRFRRSKSVQGKKSGAIRSKSETLGRSRNGRNRTPKRVRSLVNWFEKLAAKHNDPDPVEEQTPVKGSDWKPPLSEIMTDMELSSALESFMSRLYCEENLLYLKELRDLSLRFGGGAPIGDAHLCSRMSPTFGVTERSSTSHLFPLKPSPRLSTSNGSGFVADDEDDDEDEYEMSPRDDMKSIEIRLDSPEPPSTTQDEQDRRQEEENDDEDEKSDEPPSLNQPLISLEPSATVGNYGDNEGDSDLERDDVEVIEPSISVTQSAEYHMSGIFEQKESEKPVSRFVKQTSVDSKELESADDLGAPQSSIRIHDSTISYTVVSETAPAACKRLWREYISQNAFHQVNLSYDVREGIRANIRALSHMTNLCDSEIVDIFIDSQKEIEKLIRTDTLSKFYDSPDFIVIANSRPA